MEKIIFFIIIKYIFNHHGLNNQEIMINHSINQNSNHSHNLSSIKTLSNKKNLLMSLVINYSWEKIFPFIKSLIKVNFSYCDIIVFINGISKSVIDNLKSFGIIIYEIKTKFKSVQQIFNYRWKIYRDFLNLNKDKYNLVLSIDIRDTIIQNDLFGLYENSKPFLGFSCENENLYKLINKEWIINTFGIELFKNIAKKRTINAGTIWGTSDIFLKFSNILYEKLLMHPEAVDQSVINYLIYYENILNDSIRIFDDDNSPVLTLGLTRRKNIILDSNSNIINKKGKIVSIIHQYDRHPDLKQIMKERFCPELIHEKFIKFNNF